MLRRSSLLLLALLAFAGPASAQSGINLSWNDCGTFGTLQRTFACDTNVGQHTLVASFISGLDLTQLVGIAGVIDLCSMDPVLPGWWQMGSAGACRPNALSVDFNFLSDPPNCADYWQGAAQGGFSYTFGQAWGFNGARLRVVAAIPSNAIQPLDGTTEYYAYRVRIRNDASTGTGACSRCNASVCIILNSLQLAQPVGVGDYTLVSPIMRNYVQWQGYVEGCPFIVPVKKTSWGQIKAMFR